MRSRAPANDNSRSHAQRGNAVFDAPRHERNGIVPRRNASWPLQFHLNAIFELARVYKQSATQSVEDCIPTRSVGTSLWSVGTMLRSVGTSLWSVGTML